MAKPKTPLLSLGASGTIGDALTFQRRSGTNFAREKPIPTDLKTLAQMYQRWDYQDYTAQWHELTPAEKLIYRKAGSKLRMPAFAYFMSIKLKTLPDIVGRWRLDEIGGTTALDSSKNTNNGTFFGTTPATGRIDTCRLFDGIDDHILIPHHSSLDLTEELSFEAFVYPLSLPGIWSGCIFQKHNALRGFPDTNTGRLYVTLFQGGGIKHYNSLQALDLNQWQHVAVTFSYSANELIFYHDGDMVRTMPANNLPIDTSILAGFLGAFWHTYENWHGYIDQASLLSRVLTPSDIKRHAERRYPL